jgi:hypothetical protein
MLDRSLRALAPLFALALLASIDGCHDSTPTRPVVVTVLTPPPVRAVIATTSFSGFVTNIWVSIPLELSQKGALDITVDWTSPSTWMYVYFGATSCTYDQLTAHKCPFSIKSETKDPKPRLIYTGVLEPGTYYIFLYNVPWNPHTKIGTENTEAVSIQVGLTVGGSGQQVEEPVRLSRPVTIAPPRL